MNRISTSQVAARAVELILDRQRGLSDLQQTISTGRKMQRISDDPAAASQAERTRSEIASNTVESRMIGFARLRLAQIEGALGDGQAIMQRARDLMLAANNDTYSDNDRAKFAAELGGLREELFTLANRGDGLGSYLFGGNGSRTAPFTDDGVAVSYVADPGAQNTGSEGRFSTSIDGRSLFETVDNLGAVKTVFQALDDTIASLQDPANATPDLHTAIADQMRILDRGLERFGTARALAGHQMNAIDRAEQDLDRGEVAARERLSELVDADLAQAISDLAQQQTQLDAAMQTYVKISGRSLFDYIR
ncbi:MAG: flagellar hook-associated protein FlgL [Burkholderiaceae bacterium]